MNETRFLSQLRQYAEMKRRMRRSFTEQANALMNQRAEAIMLDVADPAEQERQLKRLAEIAEREYGRYDAEWKNQLGTALNEGMVE